MTALNITPILRYRSAIGLAKETTLNTPVTPAVLVPGTELTLATDAGMFFPSELTGYRDKNINPLLGNRENKGNLVTPYFPSIAVPLFIGAIGPVFGHSGTSVSTAKNGTLAAAAAGATSVTYTITNGTPAPIMGDYLQVGAAVGNFGSIYALNGNQVIKVGSVSGAGPYVITTVDPLLFAISASTVAQACVPPFYAAGQTSEVVNLPSFTLEKTYGRLQSLQFSGCLVNKYDFNLETGKKEAEITVESFGNVK